MNSTILSLATAVPPFVVAQARIAEELAERLALEPEKAEKMRRIFAGSAIDTRHVVVNDFGEEAGETQLYASALALQVPSTAQRNAIYKREAIKLAERAARDALDQWGRDPEGITHVVSVSCTGMMAPGLEFLLVDRLGLSRSVDRLGINFMGCFGAIRGLSVAKALAQENPKNRVLLVCTELCSLHFQSDTQIDTFVANALFSDGAAAVVVGCEPKGKERALWELVRRGARAMVDSTSEMTWEASNHGYVMRLSKEVPGRIRRAIGELTDELLDEELTADECDWAIHPGGKAVLHGISLALGLTRQRLATSWDTLAEYGNMSSATVLFILEKLLRAGQHPWAVCLACGPGLSIEGFLLKRGAHGPVC